MKDGVSRECGERKVFLSYFNRRSYVGTYVGIYHHVPAGPGLPMFVLFMSTSSMEGE